MKSAVRMKPATFKMDEETSALVEQAVRKSGRKLSDLLREGAREVALKYVHVCDKCGGPHGVRRTQAA